jgi:hypothetical protein
MGGNEVTNESLCFRRHSPRRSTRSYWAPTLRRFVAPYVDRNKVVTTSSVNLSLHGATSTRLDKFPSIQVFTENELVGLAEVREAPPGLTMQFVGGQENSQNEYRSDKSGSFGVVAKALSRWRGGPVDSGDEKS